MKCYICDKSIDPIKTNGKEIYPHRKDLYDLTFWKCPDCNGYVGAHKNSEKPLGCIVSKEVKKIRILIHSVIDPLWKSKQYKRKELYKMVSKHIGYDYHTAEIRDIIEAVKILRYVNML